MKLDFQLEDREQNLPSEKDHLLVLEEEEEGHNNLIYLLIKRR